MFSFQGEEIGVHPWYLMLPAAISCSFAFMLPVATPPNAIVFSGGHLKVKDMVCMDCFRRLLSETGMGAWVSLGSIAGGEGVWNGNI